MSVYLDEMLGHLELRARGEDWQVIMVGAGGEADEVYQVALDAFLAAARLRERMSAGRMVIRYEEPPPEPGTGICPDCRGVFKITASGALHGHGGSCKGKELWPAKLWGEP